MSSLDRALRKVAEGLVKSQGQRVILRTGDRAYTPGTGAVSESSQDRVVRGVLSAVRRRSPEGSLVLDTTLTVAARGLYVEAEFRLPEAGDAVIVGCEDIYGDDDNPGWDGGTEYRVAAVTEQWGNEEVVAYVLTLER